MPSAEEAILSAAKSIVEELSMQSFAKTAKKNSGLVSTESMEDHEKETVGGNQSQKKVVQFLSPESGMFPNTSPIEATLSSLDFFQGLPLFITFNTSSEQKLAPVYAPNGPTLDFEIVGDRSNFIDLQNFQFEVKCKIMKSIVRKIVYDAAIAASTYSPCLVNNTFQSVFSECSVAARGIKFSSTNSHYAQKNLIETEFSCNKRTQETRLRCQSRSFKKDLANLLLLFCDGNCGNSENEPCFASRKNASDFLPCDKHLIILSVKSILAFPFSGNVLITF